METRITERGPLHNDDGTLAQRGWATQLLLDYDRRRIKAAKHRIKEWDYYLVNDDDYALCFTIGDLGYIAMISASLLDFGNKTFVTESTLGILPMGKMKMPWRSDEGITHYDDKRADMTYEVSGGMRRLHILFRNFLGGNDLHAEIVLDHEPQDSMVISTPWAEDPKAFYYNQKIVGMRAVGSFDIGELHHDFSEENSFGLLDWGRGVWTRDNTWFWGVAQGMQDGHLFGFNLGYGFGDTSAASENMLFVDGIAHKLGRVDFGIPVRDLSAKLGKDKYDLMSPWHMTDDANRLDLEFTPDIDRVDFIDMKLVRSDQHQIFGLLNGHVVLDDASTLQIKDLRGSAEVIHNVY